MDKVLKRRLIGASILIALAVIFVPMLLVGPDGVDGGSGEQVNIPPRPDSAREVRRIPLNPETARVAEPERAASGRDAGAQAGDESPAGDASPPPERPRVDEAIVLRPDLAESPSRPARDEPAEQRDGAQGESAPAAPPAPGDGPASEGEGVEERAQEPPSAQPGADTDGISLGDWVVQVASFASRDSSDQVRDRLEALGHIVARDEIVRGQSRLFRLRTGPYSSREAAEQALAQISATVAGVEPMVRRIDRDLRAGMTSGFAVQVGSFVSEDNAESETERLKGLDFEAFRFSEEVGERRIWRVMVGPVANRAEADALEARLAEQAGVEGLVVSY